MEGKMFRKEEKMRVPASWRRYADRVVKRLRTSGALKRQIKDDLYETMYERLGVGDSRRPEDVMGSADGMARDFAEHLNIDFTPGPIDEYESEVRFFGIPLAHIVKGRGRTKVAKGIFAVGPIAVGVVAFGGVSLGVFTFGGVSLALLAAFGGAAIGGALAMGGLAVAGIVSMGALAIAGDLAVGAMAIAKNIAVGSKALAHIVGYYDLPMQGATFAFQLPEGAFEMMLRVAMEFPNSGGLIRVLMWLFMVM